MFDILSNILGFGLELIADLGYWGIFIVTVLEAVIPPIPSEIILPFTGYLVYTGQLLFWGIILSATVANMVGALFFYYIGKYGGRWFLIKYGRYLGFKEKDIDNGDKWFDRYGKLVVFFGRMIPIIRSVISIPAGVSKMPLGQFITYSFIGSAIWNITLVSLGYLAGEHWENVSRYIDEYKRVAEIGIILIIIWYIIKKLNKKNV